MRSIENDISRIPELHEVGLALVRFAESISHSSPTWEKEQWVFRPKNFVTFRIQSSRARSIRISLRGRPTEFLAHELLHLKDNMGNGAYSVCYLKSAQQLAAAATYIDQAYDIYSRGSKRQRRRPELIYR